MPDESHRLRVIVVATGGPPDPEHIRMPAPPPRFSGIGLSASRLNSAEPALAPQPFQTSRRYGRIGTLRPRPLLSTCKGETLPCLPTMVMA